MQFIKHQLTFTVMVLLLLVREKFKHKLKRDTAKTPPLSLMLTVSFLEP